jgi:hypothetical protein
VFFFPFWGILDTSEDRRRLGTHSKTRGDPGRTWKQKETEAILKDRRRPRPYPETGDNGTHSVDTRINEPYLEI